MTMEEHVKLMELLQDHMTDDDVEKFKSFCSAIIPPGILEKKTEARDVLVELTAVGTIAPNKYEWLYKTFVYMNRTPLCDHLKDAEENMKQISITQGIYSYV